MWTLGLQGGEMLGECIDLVIEDVPALIVQKSTMSDKAFKDSWSNFIGIANSGRAAWSSTRDVLYRIQIEYQRRGKQ